MSTIGGWFLLVPRQDVNFAKITCSGWVHTQYSYNYRCVSQ